MHRRFIFVVGLFVMPYSAWADSLDGDWCHPTVGKLTIDGAVITTPSGRQVSGTYGRHRFEYTAPAGDWQAGKPIVIQQFSDELMELRVDGKPGRQWRPCQVVS
jgi:hypothetical protein